MTVTETATFTATATSTPTPTPILVETFENTLDAGWSVTTGTVSYSSNAYDGTAALGISSDAALQLDYIISPGFTPGYVEAWVYDDASDSSVHFELSIGGPGHYSAMGIMSNHSTGFYTIWAGALTLASARTTGWHHFKWTHSGGTAKAWIDGTEYYSFCCSWPSIDRVTLYVGDIANPGLTNGAVDGLRIVPQ